MLGTSSPATCSNRASYRSGLHMGPAVRIMKHLFVQEIWNGLRAMVMTSVDSTSPGRKCPLTIISCRQEGNCSESVVRPDCGTNAQCSCMHKPGSVWRVSGGILFPPLRAQMDGPARASLTVVSGRCRKRSSAIPCAVLPHRCSTIVGALYLRHHT